MKIGFWVLLIVFSSCKIRTNNDDISFGFLIHSLENNRWQNDILNIESRCKEKGIKIILRNAEGDENKQLEQAKELLGMGVDALVIVAANQNRAAQIVRMCNEEEVPVIAYDRLIQNCNLDYIVSFDYYKVGQLMAEYVFSHLDRGNIVLLYGDHKDANAIMVKEAIERVVKNRNVNQKYNIVFKTFVENWSYDAAKYDFTKVVNCYSQPIDAVIACNVPLALSVADVLKEKGMDPSHTLITAQDISDKLIESISLDEVTMTVNKPPKQLAYGLVDLVEEIIMKKENVEVNGFVNNRQKDVSAKLYQPFVVDRNNLGKVQK